MKGPRWSRARFGESHDASLRVCPGERSTWNNRRAAGCRLLDSRLRLSPQIARWVAVCLVVSYATIVVVFATRGLNAVLSYWQSAM